MEVCIVPPKNLQEDKATVLESSPFFHVPITKHQTLLWQIVMQTDAWWNSD